MKLLAKCLGLIFGGFLTATAYASIDGSEPVICAAVEIIECVPNDECQRISAREAGFPRFLQIDFAGQQITRTKSSGDEITSAIERSEPKNRANLNLFWNKNDWQVGLYGRWTDGFDDTVPGSTVASHTEWDTQVSYSGLRAAKLTLGVENVFDEAPPFSAGSSHPQGFPVQYYDMRGRFIYAQVSLSLGGKRPTAAQK